MPIMTRKHLVLGTVDYTRLARLSGRMRNVLQFDRPHPMPHYIHAPLSIQLMSDAVGLKGTSRNELHTIAELLQQPRYDKPDRDLEALLSPLIADIEDLIARQVSQRVQAEVRQAFNPLLDQTRAITAILPTNAGWHWGYFVRPTWDMYLFYAQAGVLFTERMRRLINAASYLCRETGPYLMRNYVALTTNMIPQVRFDDQGRIHSEIHPAIDFGDENLKLYAWRGLRVPDEWFTNPKYLTAKRALGYENSEMRRAACEKLGWNRILGELGARFIDSHPNPEIGTLVQVQWNGRSEQFLKVRCGTGREFAIPVPRTCANAYQANAWTYGKQPWNFQIPEVRT